MANKQFTLEEVAVHNKVDDCWIVVQNKVYDVTQFLNEHPGGKKVVLKLAGKDGTTEFEKFHNVQEVLSKYGNRLLVGYVAGSQEAATAAAAAATPAPTAGLDPAVSDAELNLFGQQVPYGDPSWYQGQHSNYYGHTHRKWRAVLRAFVDKEIAPYCFEWDEAKSIPRELWVKSYQAGWLPGVVSNHWPVDYAGTNLAAGLTPEEYDPFHSLIISDEVARAGSGGVLWALFAGLGIGLPPVLNFGSEKLRQRVCRECLTGQKVICLAITEPSAGSDVAHLTCEAKKTADGKHYIVNGEKKWITNGTFADYFTVAVRTGGPGMAGVSLLLVERNMPGVSTRQMQCMGVWPSGTAYVTMDDVMVPVENLIGEENQGFKYIMFNFNHERWGMAIMATRFARVCYEEAFKYAHKRKTFGKRLVDHAVVRLKLAHMVRQIEATWAWVEHLAFQMKQMPEMEAAMKLAGPIALLKAQSTQVFEFCAREACQIFGGLGYTRGGQGEKVERLYREVRAFAIPGGSEEIMLELGMRQAMRYAKKNSNPKL